MLFKDGIRIGGLTSDMIIFGSFIHEIQMFVYVSLTAQQLCVILYHLTEFSEANNLSNSTAKVRRVFCEIFR